MSEANYFEGISDKNSRANFDDLRARTMTRNGED